MNDPYPTVLRIEIDRPRLKSYLQVVALLEWTAPLSLLGMIVGALIGMAPKPQAFALNLPPLLKAPMIVAAGAAVGFAAGFILTLIPYLIFRHRRAAQFSESLELSVEGTFLRLRVHDRVWADRKLHFRAIVDYIVVQSSLMRRCGIHCLEMTTTGGYRLVVLGVKDCFRIRDMLSEIDSLRETQ